MIDAETAAFLRVMFGLFPESIRQEVLSQDDFRLKFGLSSDSEITFSPGDVHISSAAFFKAVRTILAEPRDFAGGVLIKDTEWQVARDTGEPGDQLLLYRGKTRMRLPDFTALSPDVTVRLSWFDNQANEALLDQPGRDRWRAILASGPVADEQVDVLATELALTPIRVFGKIQKELDKPDLEVAALVPADQRYYERLMGVLSDQAKLEDTIREVIGPHIDNLRSRSEEIGLRLALLLCGSSLISDAIAARPIEHDKLAHLLEWAASDGDLISIVGAIEIGLAKCKDFPDIEPVIAKLVRFVIQQDPDDKNGRLALLTGLWMFVDGQLSNTGLFRNKPPFWRRLAALAQASLIERAMAPRVAEPKSFLSWIRRARRQTFYLQTLIDLRREPRWLPDLITAEQTRAEFVGRITGAAQKVKDNVRSDELKALLYGSEHDALPAQVRFPMSFLPGPLEGGMSAVQEMPEDIQSDLRTKLTAERLASNSFAALVNSALLFKINQNLIELTADTLRRVKYQLSDPKPSDLTAALLLGLATTAATTKSPDLAQQVQNLTRVTRRKPGVTLATEDYLRIALMASAAHSEIGAWSEAVGGWLTEYALGDMDKDAAATLSSHIFVLCRIEPTLWTTCSKADAACMAVAA